MASPNASTFDVVPPYRPGATDFNGAAKVDDSENPPDPTTMPSAAEYNTLCLLDIAFGKVIPVASFSVAGSATPSITAFSCASNTPVLSTFTVTRTGAGNVNVTWPANTFPPTAGQPTATVNTLVANMVSARNITNGVQVQTYNSAGVATDLDYTVKVY